MTLWKTILFLLVVAVVYAVTNKTPETISTNPPDDHNVVVDDAPKSDDIPKKTEPVKVESASDRLERYVKTLAALRQKNQDSNIGSAAGSGLALTPLPTKDLMAHFDAAQGITLDGKNVSSWADQSGKGHDAVQDAKKKRPSLISACGTKYVQFTGKEMLSLPEMAGHSNDVAIFVVCQMDMVEGRKNQVILGLKGSKARFNFMTLHKGGSSLVKAKNFISSIPVGTSLMALGFNSGGMASTIFCGAESEQGPAVKTVQFAGGGAIGAMEGVLAPFSGLIRAIVIYGAKQTPAAVKRIRDHLSEVYGCCARDEDTFICCDGDSLTQAKAVLNEGYDRQLALLFKTQPKITNVAIGGQSVASMATNAFDVVDREVIQNLAYSKQIVILWGGSNDIEGADTAYNIKRNARGWIEGRQTLGTKTVILTILPRADLNPECEKIRLEFNEWIRAGTSGADLVVDVASDPRLQDPKVLTYFAPDHIHLNAAGQGIIAAHVKLALESLRPN
ncbi:MAG: lysophospholipase L1-like esterase [Planctomycetota bacterium]|jgi:lysophospholipase L1-like esterase